MIRDEELKTVVAMNWIKGSYLQLALFHILLVALYHEMPWRSCIHGQVCYLDKHMLHTQPVPAILDSLVPPPTPFKAGIVPQMSMA